MESLLTYSLANLPAYLTYVLSLGLLMAAFVALYLWITPYREIQLIRQGNNAAAVGFTGVLIGFALPLASIASATTYVLDLILWSVIALVGQSAAFLLAGRLMGDLRQGIEADKVSYGILVAGLSITTGIINAASLTY
ncbi:MAG TPA: DUF350 domain-containing protein [Azospirillaceae bacterium]|nr:DUF350 domain-containing protein [Azospirillaceae bacterium]